MKIALYGASGMIGSRVTKEATERGLEITAITEPVLRCQEPRQTSWAI